jgi:mannose-6-phosphate isomerase
MAVSDNVVNSAFVPPAERDIPTFVDMLTYTSRDASHWSLPSKPFSRSRGGRTTAFSPPLEEFDVLWTRLGADPTLAAEAAEEALAPAAGPTIGIVTQGKVKVVAGGEELELPEGGIAFVAPGNEITVQTVGSGEGEVWWAAC